MSNDQNRWHMDEEKLAAEVAVAGPTKPSSLPFALSPALENADQIEVWFEETKWWERKGFNIFLAANDERPVKTAWFPSEELAKFFTKNLAQTIICNHPRGMILLTK